MELDEILTTWPIAEPATLRPTEAGTNNLTGFVDTPTVSYFFRVYQNTRDPRRVRYEHALLAALARCDLPFAVPSPIETREGDTFAGVRAGGATTLAALFAVIPGRHPERGSPREAAMSGAALAMLHRALARVDVTARPPAGTFGDLAHVHAAVPDPLAMVASLPVGIAQRRRISALIASLLTDVPPLYATLPRQIVHADFARSNLLIDRDRVSGILDFEFAAPDLRAIDLASGLWSFSSFAWGSGAEWPILAAFVRGYVEQNPLLDREIAALPTLLRLREIAALVHRVGRWRQGLATEADIKDRVERILAVDDWVGANAEKIAHPGSISDGSTTP